MVITDMNIVPYLKRNEVLSYSQQQNNYLSQSWDWEGNDLKIMKKHHFLAKSLYINMFLNTKDMAEIV